MTCGLSTVDRPHVSTPSPVDSVWSPGATSGARLFLTPVHTPIHPCSAAQTSAGRDLSGFSTVLTSLLLLRPFIITGIF